MLGVTDILVAVASTGGYCLLVAVAYIGVYIGFKCLCVAVARSG